MTGVSEIEELENEVLNCMGEYKPSFYMTDRITNLVAAISEQIGQIKVLSHGNLNPHLRKKNRTYDPFVACDRAQLAFP